LVDVRIRVLYDDDGTGQLIIRENDAIEDESNLDYIRNLGVSAYTDFLTLINKVTGWLRAHDVKEIRLDEV